MQHLVDISDRVEWCLWGIEERQKQDDTNNEDGEWIFLYVTHGDAVKVFI